MSDIIHVLPDNVANQIAAGEVVQRPASVLKELVENSIDADATTVTIIVKDAGRTLLQVIDDGKGMSETDARLCFERHATSKISSADDLFSLHTMGFRGEALPSICSVSQLELRTKRAEDEMGTVVVLNGGMFESQEPVACPNGTSISVKNLFFNVPARRKFLKSNNTEFTHIEREFFRIALVNPQVKFELYNNDKIAYHLNQGSLRERIVAVYGKSINAQLYAVNVSTTVAKIGGFVGKPETAKKSNEHQFFFVNGRYMRHPYFHKAIVQAYERLVPAGTSPDYFIYFEIDPSKIDVNIHPTKTEIKFEEEQTIWPILLAGVRETLGKFNVVQSLDFDHGEDVFSANSFFDSSNRVTPPTSLKPTIDPNYNPFKTSGSQGSSQSRANVQNWDKLYEDFESQGTSRSEGFPSSNNTYMSDFDDSSSSSSFSMNQEDENDLELEGEENKIYCLQLKNKYIITITRSGLLCIDQHRAHVKVLYERFRKSLEARKSISQKLMFPFRIDVVESDALFINEMSENLKYLGFDLSDLGGGSFSVSGIPSDCSEADAKEYLYELVAAFRQGIKPEERSERVAMKLAEVSAVKAGKRMTESEMTGLVSQLFSLPLTDYTVDGRPIIAVFSQDEIDKKLK